MVKFFFIISSFLIVIEMIKYCINERRIRKVETVPADRIDEWKAFIEKQINLSLNYGQLLSCADLIALFNARFSVSCPDYLVKSISRKLTEDISRKQFSLQAKESSVHALSSYKVVGGDIVAVDDHKVKH